MPTRLERLRTLLNGWLDRFVAVVYVPSLRTALDWRYLSLAGFAVMILLTAALIYSRARDVRPSEELRMRVGG